MVLGVATGASEAEVFWTDFLRSLADRGLRGVQLVIAASPPAGRAVGRRPQGPARRRRPRLQRHTTALPRALAAQPARPRQAQATPGRRRRLPGTPRSLLRGVGLKTIVAQESEKEAFEQWNKVADALREKDVKLGELMDAAREDVLAYMDFNKDHWTKISSTNPLERLNKEIKRRTPSRVFLTAVASIGIGGSLAAPPSHTTGHTGPYHGGSLDYAAPGVMAGRPRAARSAFESAMLRAGLAAIRQGPCALPAVWAASRRGTPRRVNCSNRFRPWRHCFHTKARSLRRSHWCKVRNTDGVWQKPK